MDSRSRALAALRRGDLDGLRRELAAGLSPDSRDPSGRTLLHDACFRPTYGAPEEEVRTACIAALLSSGADPRARARNGCTPLHFCTSAAEDGTNARLLLAAGADINALSNSKTVPLHTAASNRATACVEVLVAAGARVDVACFQLLNLTPLDAAATSLYNQEYVDRKIVWLLLRAGAIISPTRLRWAEGFARSYFYCEQIRPYLQKIVDAGSFKHYEKQRIKALVAIFAPKFDPLPRDVIPTILRFAYCPGMY